MTGVQFGVDGMAKNISVRKALDIVSKEPANNLYDVTLDTPVYLIISRILFDMANDPNPSVKGAMGRANQAQRMISLRTAGVRPAGTVPLTGEVETIEFLDLTRGAIE